LQKTPFSFDVSVWEFFWPLLAGARLVMARPGGHQDAGYLVETIGREQITTLHFVPSMLQVFLEERELGQCASLRRVICSGEALPFELQEKFFARFDAVELHNLYGPTEAAVDVTSWRCERGSARRIVPIGRAIANTQVCVLDEWLNLLPVGVAGELHIGGVALARGYFNRPSLTAERFIPHPLSSLPGARLYKTGDLARRLASGEIEFLGRLDHQVKLRGFRIELGEIESNLCQHEQIREAVVIARPGAGGQPQLVAYLVSEGEELPKGNQLRQWLGDKLPDYMIPGIFVQLGELPLTPNGKVDRKELPAPTEPDQRVGSEASEAVWQTPTEEALGEIWREVLGLKRVGAEERFFELGGHSLLATQVLSRVRQRFDVDLPLRRFFKTPTIAGLARVIEELREAQEAQRRASILETLTQLSDEELDAELNLRLSSLN
jgi:acyl-coenzyme A synthetase/AMP-(fatty) acid ligase/acyl carrier protein